MPLAQTIGLDTLSKYFHLPINDVAKELGVCATVLKKICRKNGIPRWPHRKIKSLDKMIMTLEVSVAKNPEDGERIRHEIHTLKNKKMFLMKNPNVLATKAPNMKKSVKAQKSDKSPVESPESPSSRSEHPHHSYPSPYGYPYGAYPPEMAGYPGNIYASYGMPYPGMKAQHYPYPYSPYPPHYPPEHLVEHHRRAMEAGEECISPSMVVEPVAAALFLQVPHPHLPHPSSMQRTIDSPQAVERSQWVPTDHPSAFTPKNLRAKHSPTSSSQPGYLPDLYADQQPPHMVPQHSPQHHPHHSPSSSSHPHSDYLIQLPEIRLPEEKDKPKLSTLEPVLYRQQANDNNNETSSSPSATPSSPSSPTSSSNTIVPSSSPTSSSANGKWQLPEWFEAEQQMLRREAKGRKEEGDTLLVPSERTPPLSVVGE